MSLHETARAFKIELSEARTFHMSGTLWRLLATGDDTAGLVGALDERCLVGPPLHVHDDADEFFYVLDGQLTFFVGSQRIEASTGAFVYLPRYVHHGFQVDSQEARIFNFVTPAGFERIVVDNGKAAKYDDAVVPMDLEAMQQQDPAEFAKLWKKYNMRLVPREAK